MRFKIPRYIDYEIRIFGPANFKQFLFILAGMIVIGFLYLIIDGTFAFMLAAFIVTSVTLALAFGKIQGQSLLTMIQKYLTFRFSGSKTYLWKKKNISHQAIRPDKKEEVKEEEDPGYKTVKKKGRLDKMSKKIETF